MKKAIHPQCHEINVTMTDGSTFKTRSTMGKPGDTLKLDIDPLTHPAWTGKQNLMENSGQLAKFKWRFQNFKIDKTEKKQPEAPSSR